MAVLDLLHSVKQYFRWNLVILIVLTCITYLTPIRIVELILSFLALTLAYIFCGHTIYEIAHDFNFTIRLFDEDTQQAYRYVTTHYLIFAGGFWIGYYLIILLLNLRTFLTSLVGDTANINGVIIMVGLASLGLQILGIGLYSKRRRFDDQM